MKIKKRILKENISLYSTSIEFDAFQATQNGHESKVEAFVNSHAKEINNLDDENYTLLHYAVKHNRVNLVRLLLKNRANANVRGPDGMTPLHFAAKFGNPNSVGLLLLNGANTNEKDDKGQVALHYACRRGSSSTVQILLNHGADLNAIDEDYNTPLHFCALQGSFEVAQLLVKNGANVCAQDVSDITPIMLAAAEGAILLLQLFVETAKEKLQLSEKQILEKCDHEDSNSLHFAVQNNQIKAVSFIADSGVDLDRLKYSGFSALHLASAAGLDEIGKILLDRGANVAVVDSNYMTPLHTCALHNNFGIAKNLVDHGANVHAVANDLTCPIHLAAQKGALEMLSFLLSAGADSCCQDAQMRTALHYAVESNHFTAVEILLNRNSISNIIDLTDHSDQTALHYAARKNCHLIINLLLSSGASQSLKDFEEHSALHIAAKYGNEQSVKNLLDSSREETNDDDIDGCTPLILAARYGHSKVIQLLIDNGADVTIRDEYRRSALMLAAKNGHVDATSTLIENNANVNDVDNAKNSALHFASKNGHVTIVKLLLKHQAALTRNIKHLTPLDIALQTKNSKVCAIYFQPNNLKKNMEIYNDDGHSPMKSLIENVPDIAVQVLDSCVEHHGIDADDIDYTVRYIYKYVDPGPYEISTSKVRYFALNTMIEKHRQELLKHPVVQTLLDQKWKHFARYFFYVEFILYCLFVTVLTAYVFENQPPTTVIYDATGCPIHNATIIANGTVFIPYQPSNVNAIIAAEISLYVFLVLNVLHDVVKMIFQRYRYFQNPSVYAFWFLYIVTFLFIYPPLKEPCIFQWQMGALSILLAWCFLVIYIRQFKYFSLYVVMYKKVSISMLKTFSIFIFIMMAFALAFHIMLARVESFTKLLTSFLRILCMMLGEFDYSNTFVDNSPFTNLVEVVFLMLMCLLTVVLINLMVIIAIGDIDSIKQDAYVEKLKLQVDYIYDLETNLPHWLQKKLHQPYFDFKPNRYKIRLLTKLRKLFFNVDKSNVFISDEAKTPIQDLLEEYASNLKEINAEVNEVTYFIIDAGINSIDQNQLHAASSSKL